MRKKKVLSVYGFLLLFGLGLAAFNSISFGSITGKVVAGEDYNEDLFFGDKFYFKFYPDLIALNDGQIEVRGDLVELSGIDHELQITSYTFKDSGEISGTFSDEIFLGSHDSLKLDLKIPAESNSVKFIMYIEDESSSIRVYKELEQKKSRITGSVVEELDDVKGYGSFLLGLLICGSLILFVTYKFREHRKSLHLSHAISHNQHRKFIDLDVR